MKSCAECKLYPRCNDRNKGVDYWCKDFKRLKVRSGSILEILESGEDESYPDTTPLSSVAIDKSSVSREAEFNLMEMVEESISNPNPIPRDMKIDDRDLKEFPNFYEWCMSPEGANQPPYARQLAIGIHLCGQYCPRCSHPKFQSIYTVPYKATPDKVAENVEFLHYGVCRKCKATRSELFASGELNQYTEFAGCIGQRSGKSATFSLIAPYIIHHYLKMQNPTRVLGLMQHSTISATFVGLTFARAVALLWSPVHTLILNSKWFQGYHQLLDTLGAQYGEELYAVKDTFIQYRHRSMFLYPLGPNKRTLRGDTRFLAGIDELGWFFNGGVDDDEGREKASGREVHGALDRSLKTVRTKVAHRVVRGYNNILSGYLLSLSSPSHARDMIMTLVNTHENSNDVLTVHLPTWKFNPDYNSRDDFSKEYREDFARAERDFAAQPALNNNPFISEEDAPQLQNCFTGQNRCNYEYKIVEKPGSDRKYKSIRIIGCSAVVQQPRTILAIDAGLTNNSFTLTVGTRQGRKMSFPVLIECAPVKGEEIINFNHIYENCIKPLIKAFNVVTVLADRWQSIKILQDIEEDFGIEVIQYSLRYGDFVEAKSYLLLDDPLVELPKPEIHFDDIGNHSATNYPHCFNRKPAAHLYLQFLTVKEIGRTVDKGDGLTDDIFRSFMLALTHLIDEGFSQRLIGGVERGAGGIAVVGSKAGAAMGATLNNHIGTMSSRK